MVCVLNVAQGNDSVLETGTFPLSQGEHGVLQTGPNKWDLVVTAPCIKVPLTMELYKVRVVQLSVFELLLVPPERG